MVDDDDDVDYDIVVVMIMRYDAVKRQRSGGLYRILKNLLDGGRALGQPPSLREHLM